MECASGKYDAPSWRHEKFDSAQNNNHCLWDFRFVSLLKGDIWPPSLVKCPKNESWDSKLNYKA